jgi:protein phosphatase
MRFGQKTDVGVEKMVNEDAILVIRWETLAAGGTERFDLVIVADGVGGSVAGEIASQQTVEAIVERISLALTSDYRQPTPRERGRDVGGLLRSAVEWADSRVRQIVTKNPTFSGMGSALVTGLFHGPWLHVAHLGDCRCYRIHGGSMDQLTKDHSLVQKLVDLKEITPEEAFRHPNDNVILRSIGREKPACVEVHRHRVEAGDTYLFATDGAVSDIPISSFLALASALPSDPSARDLETLCSRVVEAAKDPNEGATLDNISIVAAHVDALAACAEAHGVDVWRYEGRLRQVETGVPAHFGATFPYGVDSPSFRLNGWKARTWALPSTLQGNAEVGRAASEEGR